MKELKGYLIALKLDANTDKIYLEKSTVFFNKADAEMDKSEGQLLEVIIRYPQNVK